jgi:TPR repeat protein
VRFGLLLLVVACAAPRAAEPLVLPEPHEDPDAPAFTNATCRTFADCQDVCRAQHHPDACRRAGELAQHGFGVDHPDESLAVGFYEDACKNHDGRACTELGLLHDHSKHFGQDPSGARSLYQNGCDLRDALGCFNLLIADHNNLNIRGRRMLARACDKGSFSDCYAFGDILLSEDDPHGPEAIRAACAEGAGLVEACIDLANLYDQNRLQPRPDGLGASSLRNLVAMVTTLPVPDNYQTACGGTIQKCNDLGFQYEQGRGFPQDHVRAVELYTLACDGGLSAGCDNLGWMFEHGFGVAAEDRGQAVALYEKACKREPRSKGCFDLGRMVARGDGTARDDERAVFLFSETCNEMNVEATNNLGCDSLAEMLRDGRGGPRNVERALLLFEHACESGDPKGCFDLGFIYDKGVYAHRDLTRSRKLIERSCDEGYGPGCVHLGFLYENGDVLAKDEPRAAALFSKGCDLGTTDGCAAGARLAAKRGPDPLRKH